MTDRVDVRQLVNDIRAQVRRRYENGEYPAEIAAELEASYGEHVSGRVGEELRRLREFRFSGDVEVASQKKVIKPLVSGGKRAVRGGLRWYTNSLLAQMERFSHQVAAVIGALGARLGMVEEQVDALRQDVNAVRREPVVEGSLDYVGFENRFRGDPADVAERQRQYAPLFAGAPGRVLDVGCGRGEFLSVLRHEGIDAYGIDRHHEMVLECRAQSLDVVEGDALRYLESVETASLGGIFSAQVVEHFEPDEVVRFFDTAARTLAPGGVLVVETVNPQSLYVFTHSLYMDPSHKRPVHPLTLAFLAERAGFSDVQTRFTSEVPQADRPLPMPDVGSDELRALREQIDENFRRIDAAVFGPQDFAIVARR